MGSIASVLAQRIALGLLLLFLVSLLIFVGTILLPGDVAQQILGQSATPEALANLRKELGVNRPPVERYLDWLGGLLTGDLGTALTSGQDINEAIGRRLANTLFLAFWAAIIAVPLAIFLGLLAVRYRDRWPDKSISATTLTTISMPEFVIGYILMFILGVKLNWFSPTAVGYRPDADLLTRLDSIAIPILVLTLVVLAHMMRMTRAAILNVMQSAYIETAELKGLTRFAVISRHAFPNSISPVINVVMLNLAYLVVGVVVVEVVFVYPGMGQYLVDHVTKRDLPVVQACGMIFATIYIGLNLIADLVSILANPRLRHPK
ncbi:MAG: ABC transporter permease [Aestuariivita sp.]|nr:ABC transporter permease [Aestuariivita sp.]MCY4203555.1 ABC transporter permease [Aestuariivita sp.]